jgi:hypothetical protein
MIDKHVSGGQEWDVSPNSFLRGTSAMDLSDVLADPIRP